MFSLKNKTTEKVAVVEEEIDGIDMGDIGNFKDLLRVVFINEECGYLRIVVDDRELTTTFIVSS